jgi:hypothetical protein
VEEPKKEVLADILLVWPNVNFFVAASNVTLTPFEPFIVSVSSLLSAITLSVPSVKVLNPYGNVALVTDILPSVSDTLLTYFVASAVSVTSRLFIVFLNFSS